MAGVAGIAVRPILPAADADPALIVVNAKVYTMDPRLPRADAFAISDGKFIAVGTTSEMRSLARKKTRIVDAKRMTIVPGFIDTHNHPDGTTVLYETLVGNPYEVEFVTIESIVDKLKANAQKTPAGYWVDGYYLDDTKIKDKQRLTILDLDRVSTEHPVAVFHRGGHTVFFNSKAFELAGITRSTPNPKGGTFDRDANGELTGRVTDNARNAFGKVGKSVELSAADSAKRERDGLAYLSKQFVRYGLTTVHHEGGDLSALQDVRARGDLKHRVSYEAWQDVLDPMIASGIRTGLGDEWIRLGATGEHAVDGSFSERTMAMSVPFPGSNPPYMGNVVESQEELDAWVEKIHRAGIQVNCHANGDVAIEMYVAAIERAQKLFPVKDARPKITHCTMVNDDIIRRMKALDAVPALFSTYAYYNSDKFQFYGEDLMKRMMAFRTLLDAGIKVTGGSDFFAGPFAVLMGIQGQVTRTGWDGKTWGANQRITVDEALRVATINGAYATHEERVKGSIAEGKLADFVMLAEDPHTVNPERIKDIEIVRTVVGGETMYQH
ncbi:MAG: amidohydrolase [Gemmatimonadaceae bacterium]|nr:amidohydrolase [Gemmatimonadaceae bacterium]